MRMRGAEYHFRTQSAFEQSGDVEEIITLCILAFPSLWVSCNTNVVNPRLLKENGG
jgi:hypothetical protein